MRILPYPRGRVKCHTINREFTPVSRGCHAYCCPCLTVTGYGKMLINHCPGPGGAEREKTSTGIAINSVHLGIIANQFRFDTGWFTI